MQIVCKVQEGIVDVSDHGRQVWRAAVADVKKEQKAKKS